MFLKMHWTDHALWIVSPCYAFLIQHQSTIRAKILHQNNFYSFPIVWSWTLLLFGVFFFLVCECDILFWKVSRFRTSKHSSTSLSYKVVPLFLSIRGPVWKRTQKLLFKFCCIYEFEMAGLWRPGTWLSQNLSQSFFEKKL